MLRVARVVIQPPRAHPQLIQLSKYILVLKKKILIKKFHEIFKKNPEASYPRFEFYYQMMMSYILSGMVIFFYADFSLVSVI